MHKVIYIFLISHSNLPLQKKIYFEILHSRTEKHLISLCESFKLRQLVTNSYQLFSTLMYTESSRETSTSV